MESKAKMMFNEKMSLFYPDQLWSLVPQSLDKWDTELQKMILAPEAPFWLNVKFYSDSPKGIFLFVVASFALWFLWGVRTKARFLFGVRVLLALSLFLVASDLIAHKLLKIPIGRLKPRVNGVIPGYYQALSFPSSHALNMAFCWGLFVKFSKELKSAAGKRNGFFLIISMFFLIVVGISRIALNEHYPLDVFAGWCLGLGLAKTLFPLFMKVHRWLENPSRLKRFKT